MLNTTATFQHEYRSSV